MTELVLLGAGASADAGVPTAREMTLRISEHLGSRDRELVPVLNFVLGGLLLQQGMDGNNPLLGVDVEALLSAAELLSERRTLEAAPFVAAWNPMVEWLDRPEKFRGGGFPPSELERALKAIGTGGFWASDLARKIVDTIRGAVAPGSGAVYKNLARGLTRAVRQLVKVDDPSKVDYLRPLPELARAQGRLVVATLNYDQTVEWASHRAKVWYDTGMTSWTEKETLQFRSDGVILLKLHGSTDWVMEEPEWISGRPMPERRVRLPREDDRDHRVGPAIIFGRRNKFRVEGPFLDLLAMFRRELGAADRVTVVGYSFRDEHVNYYLSSWLNGDEGRRLRVIGRSFPAAAPSWRQAEPQYIQWLRHLGDRIEFVQGDSKDVLPAVTWGT